MNNIDFPTASTQEEMAKEITCLKAIMTLMLKAMGQANAGQIILRMEKLISEHDNQSEAKAFTDVIQQIRRTYRQ